MIIQCPQCQSTYEIANAAAVAGRKVRCTRCYLVWRAEVIEAPAAAVAAGPSVAEAAVAGSAAVAHQENEQAHQHDHADAEHGDVAADNDAQLQHGAQTANGEEAVGDSQDDSLADADEENSEADDFADSDQASHEPELPGLAADRSGDSDDDFDNDADDYLAPATEPDGDALAAVSHPPSPAAGRSGNGHERPHRNGKAHAGLSVGGGSAFEAASLQKLSADDPRAGAAGVDPDYWSGNGSQRKPSLRREPSLSVVRGGRADRNGPHATMREPAMTEFAAADDPDVAAPSRRRGFAARAGLLLGWLVLLGAAGAGAASLFLLPERVARSVPGGAALYARFGKSFNMRGLEFQALAQTWVVDAKARPALEIRGEIKNITAASLKVPTVVFAFLDQDGFEIFHWATPVKLSALASGKVTKFQVKVPAPPEAVSGLEVRFATELD